MNLVREKTKGFTLIELLVSLALFTVVVVISTGTLLALVDANRQAQSVKSVVNNLNFALDGMTRTLRTGYTYHCDTTGFDWDAGLLTPNDCSGGNEFIGFIDDHGDVVAYRYNSSNNQIERNIDDNGWLALTAAEVNITEMLFYVTGAPLADGLQPTVTISIRGTAGSDAPTQTDLNIQTTVTQRILDL